MKLKIFRIAAFYIDMIIMSSLLSFITTSSTFNALFGNTLPGVLLKTLLTLWIIVILYVLYGVITNHFFSGTLGKVLLGLKVADQDGYKLSFAKSFDREFTKMSLLYATALIYGIYSMYRILTNKEVYHDKKNKTKVI